MPIKDINKWPAIMFAVNRKVKAKGRIIFLISSTNTIKLISKNGVPEGIKWDKKLKIKLNHKKNITANQKEKDKGKVTNKWEVEEKK